MARRTVTATFAGGMISDEPKPGTARYLENLVPRVDGVVPPNALNIRTRSAVGMTTANGIGASSIVGGWSGGGTVHPVIGFVGLLDIAKATAATTSTADAMGFINALGLAGTPGSSATRCLMNMADIESATSFGTMVFADHGGITPVKQVSTPTATGTAAMVSCIMGVKLNGQQTFINTENEVLLVGKGTTTADEFIYRYAGSTANSGIATAVTNGFTDAFASATGWVAPTATGTGTAGWTNVAVVTGDAANVLTTTGQYIGFIMGEGMAASAVASAEHSVREFMVTAVGTVTGTGSTATQTVYLDRRIQFSAATRYARCVIGNTAQLMSSQLSRSSVTQPFMTPVSGGGFTGLKHNPSGRDGACYHHGRLFLANGSRISWSGTVDETLQMTATGNFATGTASTSVTTAGSATYGIEYKHISLYSASSYVDAFPQVGGDIVGLVAMDDSLIVLKRGAIFRIVGGVSYDGETDAFDIQVVSNSVGPESFFSWAETPAGIVFTWDDGIWMFDGNEPQEISRGTVSNSFVENLRMHRQSSNGIGAETVATRVCSDGNNVFFTPMRYTLSTSTGGREPAFTSSMNEGQSIYNKHLVLSVRDQKWYYISNIRLNVPSCVLPIRSTRGSKYSNYWLNSWRRRGSFDSYLEVEDIHNMLHESGPLTYGNSATTAWSASSTNTLYSVAVSHPLLGMGNVDAVRPRSAIIKRTCVDDQGWSSTSTAGSGKITLIDSESSFVPASSGFMTYSGSTGVISGIPEWWTSMSSSMTGTNRSSQSTSTSDTPRAQWEVEGTTATGAANSLLDRFQIENNETAMSAPTLVYYDDYYWRDKESSTVRQQISILHVAGIEFDEVENRTDR